MPQPATRSRRPPRPNDSGDAICLPSVVPWCRALAKENSRLHARPSGPSAILKYRMSVDPKSVKVNLTSGSGVDIEWRDAHLSHYEFPFLRNACPCALCNEERGKSGRKPGEPIAPQAGELPMFKPAAKPVSAEGVGKYAIRFKWNDGHELGIYSWQWLREICPCSACQATAQVV